MAQYDLLIFVRLCLWFFYILHLYVGVGGTYELTIPDLSVGIL